MHTPLCVCKAATSVVQTLVYSFVLNDGLGVFSQLAEGLHVVRCLTWSGCIMLGDICVAKRGSVVDMVHGANHVNMLCRIVCNP